MRVSNPVFGPFHELRPSLARVVGRISRIGVCGNDLAVVDRDRFDKRRTPFVANLAFKYEVGLALDVLGR